jgi:hypothetical protein
MLSPTTNGGWPARRKGRVNFERSDAPAFNTGFPGFTCLQHPTEGHPLILPNTKKPLHVPGSGFFVFSRPKDPISELYPQGFSGFGKVPEGVSVFVV